MLIPYLDTWAQLLACLAWTTLGMSSPQWRRKPCGHYVSSSGRPTWMCNNRCLWRRKTYSMEAGPSRWCVRRGSAPSSTVPRGHPWCAHWPAYNVHVGHCGPCNNVRGATGGGWGRTTPTGTEHSLDLVDTRLQRLSNLGDEYLGGCKRVTNGCWK